ncbi:MAG: LysM peptidoglycan-binding domain-containing protein [Bacteroidetes bacterium]|nr:LysM peptidoglycan-binding domain-containing protein [Bacteroidota bacterium]
MIITKSTYFKITLTCILWLVSFIVQAQTKSTDIKTINGKKYYIHKVEKGQSLYAIAKTYGMDVNSILAENDEAIDGLKNGQELKIPFESLLPKTGNAIDTNKYVYHKISKGETVYGITKKFGIDEKKLASYNPTLNSGLKEGEYLIIGEKKKNGSNAKPASVTNTVVVANTKDSYTVLSGETLYGISKKINVSQDDLLKWNPEIKDGIKPGQVLKLAAPKSSAVTATSPSVASSTAPVLMSSEVGEVVSKTKKEAYNIGLFLPFKLIESEGINIDELARAKASFPATQALALDFYAGFKKAVDSLISKDFEVEIHLFDTEDRDSLKVDAICKTPEFKNLDAIFGPLYVSTFKIVSKYARAIQIPVVSPVIQQNKILFGNPLSSKVTPSAYTLIEGLADYSLDSLASANVIIVNTTAKDQMYIKTFKSRYNEALTAHKKTLKDSITEVKGVAGVKAAYVAGKQNVVVLLTNNQVYLQDFITQLYVFSEKKDIVLMGFNSVSNIDNLDQDYLNALHFHFAAPNHIDFKDSIIGVLTKHYQEVYTADPSEYYFQGFDIGMYYLSHLKTQGPDFFLKLDANPWEGVSTDFKFYRPDAETGFENRAVNIYKYSNYQLQKSGWK